MISLQGLFLPTWECVCVCGGEAQCDPREDRGASAGQMASEPWISVCEGEGSIRP